MTAVAVRPGQLFLADTSVYERRRQPIVRELLARLIASRSLATCVTVDLEVGYSARSLADAQAITKRRRSFVQLPVTEAIGERAREVQLRLTGRGLHRAPGPADLLTAAIAEHHGAVILHYDRDFEHIAAVTGQPHAWVTPAGSLD